MGTVTQRTSVEMAEEDKMGKNTPLQTFCFILSTFLAEFVACLLYYTVVLSSVMTNTSSVSRAFTEAAAYIAVLSVFMRENAAHLDPLVTIQLVVMGRYGAPWYYMFCQLLAQPLAAIVATLLIWAMTPGFDKSLGLGLESLAFGYTPGQGLLAIFLGCLITYSVLLWMLCSQGVDNYYIHTGGDFKQNTIYTLSVGFSHLCVGLGFGRIAGGYYSWYLYFFPGVISGTIDSSNWWIWFVGPLMAAIFQVALWFFWHWIDGMAFKPIYHISKKQGDTDHPHRN